MCRRRAFPECRCLEESRASSFRCSSGIATPTSPAATRCCSARNRTRPFPEELLSSAIQAALYKVGSDNLLTQAMGDPRLCRRAGGGRQLPHRGSSSSRIIDGDGLVDPVLVYRFFEPEDDGHVNVDPFSGAHQDHCLSPGPQGDHPCRYRATGRPAQDDRQQRLLRLAENSATAPGEEDGRDVQRPPVRLRQLRTASRRRRSRRR